MSRIALVAAPAVLLLVAWHGDAEAKAGDAAWAKCVWQQAPASAAKWLTLPVPSWQTPMTDAASLIGHQMIALCDASEAKPLKPNRSPAWKNLASALKAARPKTAAAAAAPSVLSVALCAGTIEKADGSQLYLHEIVRRGSGRETVSFQQFYTEHQGKPVKLPQDLRVLPGPDARTARSCRIIGAEGELIDA